MIHDEQPRPSLEHTLFQRRPLQTMASECAPLQQITASPSRYTIYTSPRSDMTPGSSGRTTPTIPSPPSGQTGFIGPRQLRPQKTPLYVPAVLRPSELMLRRRSSKPITPPTSIHNFSTIEESMESPRFLTRSTTTDSVALDSISEFEIGLQGLGKVTALPSREHWKSNHESEICDDATCTRYFSYFTRRHHCRRCGNIFCDDHSTHTIPLDQNANYHPDGTLSRACEHCFKEFQAWQLMRTSRSNSDSSEEQQPPTPVTPCTPIIMSPGKGRNSYFPGQGSLEVGSQASSVPRDWNWSTF